LWCHIKKKGLSRGRFSEELEREVRQHARHVTRVLLLAGRRVEQRVVVGTLAGQDLPMIEAGRIAAEMPLADHAVW
jgi:hypothetical protein